MCKSLIENVERYTCQHSLINKTQIYAKKYYLCAKIYNNQFFAT